MQWLQRHKYEYNTMSNENLKYVISLYNARPKGIMHHASCTVIRVYLAREGLPCWSCCMAHTAVPLLPSYLTVDSRVTR